MFLFCVGLEQELQNLHDMIMGDTLYAPESISKSVKSNITSQQYDLFGEYTLSLQASGYALLISAHLIKGWDMEGVQHMQTANIAEQKELLVKMKDDHDDDDDDDEEEEEDDDNDDDDVGIIDSEWPQGTWGLPMPISGCPDGYDWQLGYRYQDSDNTGNSNQWSDVNHFPSTGENVHNYFCMKTNEEGTNDWPAGEYCIYAKHGCPTGFSCGFIKWDDENNYNCNYHNGTLPDGIYDEDTLIHFACRQDGDVDIEIELPTQTPFYLFKYYGECQRVSCFNYNIINIYV